MEEIIPYISITKCCGESVVFPFSPGKLQYFSIYIGDDPPSPFDVSRYSLCAKVCDKQSRRRVLYNCVSRPNGRYVAVQMDDPEDSLMFCEIEVYSYPAAGKSLQNIPILIPLLFFQIIYGQYSTWCFLSYASLIKPNAEESDI